MAEIMGRSLAAQILTQIYVLSQSTDLGTEHIHTLNALLAIIKEAELSVETVGVFILQFKYLLSKPSAREVRKLIAATIEELETQRRHPEDISFSVSEALQPETDSLRLLARDICEKLEIFPIKRRGRTLVLAMTDPTNLRTLDDANFFTGLRIMPILASEKEIQEAIERYYPD